MITTTPVQQEDWGFEGEGSVSNQETNATNISIDDDFGDFSSTPTSSPSASNISSTISPSNASSLHLFSIVEATEDDEDDEEISTLPPPTTIKIKIKEADPSSTATANFSTSATAVSAVAATTTITPITTKVPKKTPANKQPTVTNGQVMSLLSEEMTVTHSSSKVVSIVVRGKLEVRAKTMASKDKNVRLVFMLHVDKTMPPQTMKFKVNAHHMREKFNTQQLSLANSENSTSIKSTYQCMIPAHPSKKKAIKIMQYVTKEHHTFVAPLQQHVKITPNVLVDERIETATNTKMTRIAFRVKITKNPAIDWRQLDIQKMTVVAMFSSHLPRGCKLLCKPKASFIEHDRTLTWNVGSIKKTKMYVDAMFTIPTSNSFENMTAEKIKPKLTVRFQVVRKKNSTSDDGSTNTVISILSAKKNAVVKGTVKQKLLIKLKF